MKKHFERGSSTYKCLNCGKLTRDTMGEEGMGLCRKCLEAQEWANGITDGIYTLEDIPAKSRELVKSFL